jgi:hypothetical protein
MWRLRVVWVVAMSMEPLRAEEWAVALEVQGMRMWAMQVLLGMVAHPIAKAWGTLRGLGLGVVYLLASGMLGPHLGLAQLVSMAMSILLSMSVRCRISKGVVVPGKKMGMVAIIRRAVDGAV